MHVRLKTVLLSLLVAVLVPPVATAQEPSLPPMQFLPDDAIISPAAGNQTDPAIAAGDDSFLVVWSDRRAADGASLVYEVETSNDIYAVRLDANGNPIDEVPFVVTQGRATQSHPQVAWNGSNWLVVYQTINVSGTGFYYSAALEAVRVSPDGQVLDTTPINVGRSSASSSVNWALASDGANWVVIDDGTYSDQGDIMAVRISGDGVVLDQPAQLIAPADNGLRFNLRLAYTSNTFLAVWNGNGGIRGMRFDRNLNTQDATPLTLLAGSSHEPEVTADGSNFYMVWQAQQPDFTMAIQGSRIDTSGVMLDGAGLNISQANQPEPFTAYDVAWDGSNFRVTWGFGGTSSARVSSTGQILDPGGVAFSGLTSGSTAAGPGGNLQLVWNTSNIALIDSDDIEGASISSTNTAGPVTPLSPGAPRQTYTDIASSGSGFLLVYRSDTSGVNNIMAQVIDAAGNPVTGAPVLLASGDSRNGPGNLAVAWNGTVYLVVWTQPETGGVMGRRVQSDGTPIDGAPFLIIADTVSPDVAAQGDTFLVVGTQLDPNALHFSYAVSARVQGSDGSILDTPAHIIGGSYATRPAVAAVGNRWLVTWQRNYTHDNPLATTAAAYVDADGSSTAMITISDPYSTTPAYFFGPAVASRGDMALVVFTTRISNTNHDVIGRLIDDAVNLQPVFNIATEASNQYRPEVAWDGAQFIVVYQDQRNRTSDLEAIDTRSDLYASRVSSNGILIDPAGFATAVSPRGEEFPNVASAGGVSIIAGSVIRNEAPFAAYRVGYRLFDASSNNWPVAVASASSSGGDTPLNVTFSSAGSHDPDGSITGYAWQFGDGQTSADANPSHTYQAAGDYVATLTVTDNQGASSTNTVHIQATAPNLPPVAIASSDVWMGSSPLFVEFRATGTFDPDGAVGDHHWEFCDGSDYWGSPAYNTFTQTGACEVTLTVWDNRGATGTDTMWIYVGTTPVPGDLNGDGQVTVADLVLAGEAWDSHLGQPGFSAIIDQNDDQHVTIDEVQWVAGHWNGN